MYAVKGNKAGSYEDARALELNGELKAAAKLYEKLYKPSQPKIKIVHRLLVLYRKLKDAEKELRYIDAAIHINEQYYAAVKKKDTKTVAISKKLNLLLGHTDKKGKTVLKTDEVLKLQKRKANLLKKQSLY
jgi:hypothetical protein